MRIISTLTTAAITLTLISTLLSAKETLVIERFRPLDPWVVRQIKKDHHKPKTGRRLYILYDNERAIGFIRFGIIDGTGVISRISVHPKHHNRGHAQKLEQFARIQLKQENITKISFEQPKTKKSKKGPKTKGVHHE